MMTVPSLPKIGTPPAPPPLRKIALYEDYAEAGSFIETAPIGESDRRKIAYGNAKALYKL
jgi:hypothetical protein